MKYNETSLFHPRSMTNVRTKIFLLSPALMTGARALQLFRPQAKSAAAQAYRSEEGLPIGDAFSFMSSLYFRGKIAYARQFAEASETCAESGLGGIYVIAPGYGLVPPHWAITVDRMRRLRRVPVDPRNREYRKSLEDQAGMLAARLDRTGERSVVILLGSVATGKYVDLLWPIFGVRLLYPRSFAGIGDMSRGALLLRAARSRQELEYVPVETLIRKKQDAAAPNSD
jgi:hypothetical protein